MISKGYLVQEDKEFFKKHIMNDYFPWYAQKTSWTRQGNEIDDNLLTHVLLARKEERSKLTKYHSPIAIDVESIIKKYIGDKEILRMCFNFTYDNGKEKTGIHKDHAYEYGQFILYLTDSFKKGETVILNDNKKIIEKIKPERYKFVPFGNNYHYNYFRIGGKRIVLIATYK